MDPDDYLALLKRHWYYDVDRGVVMSVKTSAPVVALWHQTKVLRPGYRCQVLDAETQVRLDLKAADVAWMLYTGMVLKPSELQEVGHCNGEPLNNRLDNLYMTGVHRDETTGVHTSYVRMANIEENWRLLQDQLDRGHRPLAAAVHMFKAQTIARGKKTLNVYTSSTEHSHNIARYRLEQTENALLSLPDGNLQRLERLRSTRPDEFARAVQTIKDGGKLPADLFATVFN
jgi:hypothetical protein